MVRKNETREITITARLKDTLTKRLKAVREGLDQTAQSAVSMARLATAPIRAVTKAVTSLHTAVAGLVALLAVRAAFNTLKEVATQTNEIGQAAKRLKIGTRELSKLAFAAERVGANMEDATDLVKDLQVRVGEAALEGGEKASIFARLGLDVQELVKMKPTEQLEAFSDAISRVQNETERLTIVDILLSDVGTRLLPMMEDLSEASKDAERFGGIVTPEQAAATQSFVYALQNMRTAFGGFVREVLVKAGPGLVKFFNELAQKIVDVGPKVVAAVKGIGVALTFENDLGKDLRENLIGIARSLADSMAELGALAAQVLIQGFVAVFSAAAVPLGKAIARALGKAIINAVTKTIESVINVALDVLPKFAQAVGGIDDISPILKDYKASLLDGLDIINKDLDSSREISEAFVKSAKNARLEIARAFADTQEGSVINRLDQSMINSVRLLGQGFESLADAGTKAFDDLKKSAKEADEAMVEVADPSKFQAFVNSVRTGIGQVVSEFSTLRQLGEELGRTIATQLSSGLAETFTTIIEGSKSAGEAFREFAAQTLRMIAQMLIRFALLRAIAPLGLGFNQGGQVPGFNTGGHVPGGGPNRDSVAAMLTPGEYVIQRPSVKYYGTAFLAALNARRVPRPSSIGMASIPSVGGNRLNTGGQVARGGDQPQQAIVVANDQVMSNLLAGGRDAMLRFLRQNKAEFAGGPA